MNVIIDSYNCVNQNPAGGVQTRIKMFCNELKKLEVRYKLFNKWEDKVTDYDILHIFKAHHESYDLVHFAKSKGLKVVVSSIVPINKSLKFKLNSKLAPFIRTPVYYTCKILSKADAIITQTSLEKKYIMHEYHISSEKILVIPNGVSLRFTMASKGLFRERYNIQGDYILQVGSIERNKNQLGVIRALKASGIPVVFVGGPHATQPEYYEQCKKESDSNMIFTGWINNEDDLLESAYAGAKVVVLPSFKETFGNSLIEGGMAGANLVATDGLPIFEWGISKFCRKINPTDIEDIREKLLEALSSPLYANTSEIIAQKFSWPNVAVEYKKIYETVLKDDV